MIKMHYPFLAAVLYDDNLPLEYQSLTGDVSCVQNMHHKPFQVKRVSSQNSLSDPKIEKPTNIISLDAGEASGRRRRALCSVSCYSSSSDRSPPCSNRFRRSCLRFGVWDTGSVTFWGLHASPSCRPASVTPKPLDLRLFDSVVGHFQLLYHI